jgi:hypothetical protein
MVSARRKYDQCGRRAPRSTTSCAPNPGSLSRARNSLAWTDPPCGLSPHASARISITVDLPEPFSPTSTVRPAGSSRPSHSICSTAGTVAGHLDVSTEAAGS